MMTFPFKQIPSTIVSDSQCKSRTNSVLIKYMSDSQLCFFVSTNSVEIQSIYHSGKRK